MYRYEVRYLCHDRRGGGERTVVTQFVSWESNPEPTIYELINFIVRTTLENNNNGYSFVKIISVIDIDRGREIDF